MLGVSVKDFGISFGDSKILENISFDVKQGEIVTILGSSGCGKSTILRAIASLESGYSGDIFINEECLLKDGEKQCHRDIGYIFQDYALFPHLNVKENIGFALYKMDKKTKDKKVDELLKQFDLIEHKNKQIHELSGGQQQRVSIARVLAYEPKVLLLDEPFANLDTMLRNKTKIWLKQIIRDMNLSAILVTHDQKEALSMSDRIAIINDKKIEQFSTPQELFEKPKSLYIANFLNRINLLPKELLKDLGVKIADENSVAVICIDKIRLVETSKIKAKILDISFCGDYYEVDVSLKDYESEEFIIKSSSIDDFKDNDICYLDFDFKDIKVVKK